MPNLRFFASYVKGAIDRTAEQWTLLHSSVIRQQGKNAVPNVTMAWE